MELPRVILLLLTKGRHSVTERAIRCFLEQDYEGEILLFIHNNSTTEQSLGDFINYLPTNRKVTILNKSGYSSLGEIYNDSYTYLPDYEIINHFECDDLYLPNHVSEGVKGLLSHNCSGYKPYFSWFATNEDTQLAHNLLEPSIFFLWDDVKRIKCSSTTGPQFHPIINTLVQEGKFIEDKKGIPTLIYTWLGEVFKTSGGSTNPFLEYDKHSNDEGDYILDPAPLEQVIKFYNKCTQK